MISIPHTSRFDFQDPIDIPAPRKNAYNSIKSAIEAVTKSRTPRIIPILGEAGYGKTHLYHACNQLNARIVYLASPSAGNLYSQLYFALLRTYGMGFLTEVGNNLLKQFGSYDKAVMQYPGKGANILEIIFALNDPEFSKIARYWLSGNLNNSIFNKLNILSDEEVAFLLLKIILEHGSKPVLFFIDELESILYQEEKSESIFLYKLKKIYNETPNFVLILSCITQMWDRFTEIANASIQSRLDPPKMLRRFTKKDAKKFAVEYLKHVWLQNGIPLEPSESDYLNDSEVDEIMLLSGGNPRETIKSIQTKLESKWESISEQIESQKKINEKEAEKLKDIAETISQRISNLNSGFMTQKNGFFYLFNKNNRKLLMIAPHFPSSTIFSDYLRDLVNGGNYQQIAVYCDQNSLAEQPGVFVSASDEELVNFVSEWFEQKPF